MSIEKIKRLLNPHDSVQSDIFGNPVEKMKIKEEIGFLPTSIWEINWKETKVLKEYVGDIGASRIIDKPVIQYKKAMGKLSNNTSIFNPYLTKLILNAYVKKGCKIYDPFAGGGTRAIISSTMGYKYTGVEIRSEEVDSINKRKNELNLDFTIHLDDAMKFVQPNEFDFSFTCPPYYNLEKYGGGKEDLSMARSYDDFLDMMKKVMKNVYKSLKPDSFNIWIVGNFRDKNGNLIHFNGDVIKLAMDTGFKFHDEIVVHSASGQANQRVGMFSANKKSVRIHEYVLIFKK